MQPYGVAVDWADNVYTVGKTLDAGATFKAVKKWQKSDESFPSITPHDLRHSAASLAVSAVANVKAVQRMLGHAKASMTLDVYADLFDEDLDSVAANLGAAIRSAAYPPAQDQI